MADSAFSPAVIPLWPDGAPGSENWSQQEQETYLPLPSEVPQTYLPLPFDVKLVRNIARPTLTAYLPDPSVASGTAVIVCPGGAFHNLSIEFEGTEVARWQKSRSSKWKSLTACQSILDRMAGNITFMHSLIRRQHDTLCRYKRRCKI